MRSWIFALAWSCTCLHEVSASAIVESTHQRCRQRPSKRFRSPEHLAKLKPKLKRNGERETTEEQNTRLNREMIRQRAYRVKKKLQQSKRSKNPHQASSSSATSNACLQSANEFPGTPQHEVLDSQQGHSMTMNESPTETQHMTKISVHVPRTCALLHQRDDGESPRPPTKSPASTCLHHVENAVQQGTPQDLKSAEMLLTRVTRFVVEAYLKNELMSSVEAPSRGCGCARCVASTLH